MDVFSGEGLSTWAENSCRNLDKEGLECQSPLGIIHVLGNHVLEVFWHPLKDVYVLVSALASKMGQIKKVKALYHYIKLTVIT